MPETIAAAVAALNYYRKAGNSHRWPYITCNALFDQLENRVNTPSIIKQQTGMWTCGSAAMLYELARNKPQTYASYAQQLYYRGKATVGPYKVKPSKAVRDFSGTATTIFDRNWTPTTPFTGTPLGGEADWLTMASLRDSSNWLMDVSGTFLSNVGALTLPSQLSEWCSKLGFSNVENHTNLVATKSPVDIVNAGNELNNNGKIVFLFVDGGITPGGNRAKRPPGLIPTHWVVLTRCNASLASLDLDVHNFGATERIPHNAWPNLMAGSQLDTREFCKYFYGYVCCSG